MFLNKNLNVELVDNREIVITKGPRKDQSARSRGRASPSRESATVPVNNKPSNLQDDITPRRKAGVPPRISKEQAKPLDGDEYIQTQMYEDSENDEKEYEIVTSGVRQPERERSSSIKDRTQRAKTYTEPPSRGYAQHPRRSEYKM